MKNAVIITLMFFSLLFLVPFLWEHAFTVGSSEALSNYQAPESFRLYLTQSGEIIEINTVDYLIGCLYAQIAPGYHTEALKAQATAAHTYALRLALNNQESPSPEMGGADFSNDSVTCQPYFTEEQAREYYGAEYDVYYPKIEQAARFGATRVILYENEPIYAVYHSVSAGATNTARHVWGVDFPYLKSVPSPWDREFLNFACTNEISVLNMRSSLLNFEPDIIMPLDYTQWFSRFTSDPAGYVITVETSNMVLSGGDLWRILNLRSAAFEIDYTGGVFVATTLGHGHGVGLSQFGADYMARREHECDEILNYYYTDVNISDVITSVIT